MKTRHILVTTLVAVPVLIAATVAANASRRHLDQYDSIDPSAAVTAQTSVIESDDTYSQAARAEAARQGELEAEFAQANLPGSLYEQAANGGPSLAGLTLQTALASSSPSRLGSMRIIHVETDDSGGITYESVMYGDGSRDGYIEVYWQTLLGNEDMNNFVGPFGKVKNEGPYDVVTDVRDDIGMSFRMVRVYDGYKILTVQANDIAGLQVDELIPLAKELFGLLPNK